MLRSPRYEKPLHHQHYHNFRRFFPEMKYKVSEEKWEFSEEEEIWFFDIPEYREDQKICVVVFFPYLNATVPCLGFSMSLFFQIAEQNVVNVNYDCIAVIDNKQRYRCANLANVTFAIDVTIELHFFSIRQEKARNNVYNWLM